MRTGGDRPPQLFEPWVQSINVLSPPTFDDELKLIKCHLKQERPANAGLSAR